MDVCCTIECAGACKDIERGPLSSLSWLMCLLAWVKIKEKVQRVECMNGVNLMERVLVLLRTSAADNNTPPDNEKRSWPRPDSRSHPRANSFVIQN